MNFTNPKPQHGQRNLSDTERRTHRVEIMLNDSELDYLLLFSRNVRVSNAEYLRRCLRDNHPKSIPAINRKAWSSLARIGSNLNQLANLHNAGNDVSIPELLRLLSDLRESLISTKVFAK